MTQLAIARSPIFRGIYCPHTRGQCPLHRWQINCLACDRYDRVRQLVYGASYEVVAEADG
ncbi:MAG: hypothetical protein V1862_12220 [Methanobacteriota archaeon]